MKYLYKIWIPLGLILSNLIFKGLFIGNNSVAADEPFSIWVAQMDVPSIITYLSTGNNPPLFEIILHYWLKIFGLSAEATRIPSLIFSCVAVLTLYQLSIKHLNHRIGITASLVFIFSNYHILFAHEARSYSLLAMLSLLSVYFFLNLVNKDNPVLKKQNLVAFTVLNTLIIYCHYFGWFILFSEVLFILFSPKILKKHWRIFTVSLGFSLLFYLPNIFVLFDRFIDASGNGTWVKAPKLNGIYNMIRHFSNQPVVAVFSIILLGLAFGKLLLKKEYKSVTTPTKFIAFWFFFVFFFMFSISFIMPMFIKRYLTVAAIAYPILLAIASCYILEKKTSDLIFPCILCFLFMITSNPNLSNKRNSKSAIKKVKDLKTKDSAVYICPNWFDLNFAYHFDLNVFSKVGENGSKIKLKNALNQRHIFPMWNQNLINKDSLKKYSRVIYLDAAAEFSFPDNGIKWMLNREMKKTSEFHFEDIYDVIVYESK
jgi:uncharacterized membrane protein